MIEKYWTSRKPINGLRHFVLVNEMKDKDQICFLLVSVVDVAINLKITFEELFKSGNWDEGWLDLPKNESVTKDYDLYKSFTKNQDVIDKIFVNDDSSFNIS